MSKPISGGHREADVIVVGFGAAGASAAIAAHDAGARVLVLEKMSVAGGNTSTAGGHFLCPENATAFIEYFSELSRGHDVEPDVVRTFGERMAENAEWFERLGGSSVEVVRVAVPGHGRMSEFPTFLGAERVHVYTLKVDGRRGRGQEIMNVLEGAVRARGVDVVFNCAVDSLLVEDGELCGVKATVGENKATFRAHRGVVLACGGFENNREMVSNYLGYTWDRVRYSGTPGNTGDGIRIAQKVGAALWHMNNASGPFLGFVPPGCQNAVHGLPMPSWGFICINRYGRRFGTESRDAVAHVPPYVSGPRESMHGKGMDQTVFYCDYMHPGRVDYPNIPCYAVFDEAARRETRGVRGRLVYRGQLEAPEEFLWSDGLAEEIERGWVARAEDLSSLARVIGVDPIGLQETLNAYNCYCDAGKDPEYHRPQKNLVPLRTPPYYAMQLWPTILNTQGGPKRDALCRVLDPYGNPIPRLYSAGELGSIFGFLYNAGGNIGECFASGRIAGLNAATENPL